MRLTWCPGELVDLHSGCWVNVHAGRSRRYRERSEAPIVEQPDFDSTAVHYMSLSVLDLFSIGIGPSSSHTVGPMRAAATFLEVLREEGHFDNVAHVKVALFGSLGLTGRGHGSDHAAVLGLSGELPEEIDPDRAPVIVDEVRECGRLILGGEREIPFRMDRDVILHMRRSLPGHPNGMTFCAKDAAGELLLERSYYSVGGGFVVDAEAGAKAPLVQDDRPLAYPFSTGAELLERCQESGLSIAEVVLANEESWRPAEETRARLLEIWHVMAECIERGCTREEPMLPGRLNVPRRAPGLRKVLREQAEREAGDPLRAVDWVNLYALAVNEENASGGRIVTAPTNGAAGIIPAVLSYAVEFRGADDDAIVNFLLTAGAIGILFKENASISGAEVGCQGEVGSACSMAAAGLCALLGGSPRQVENAAEIGIEHNLGLTCDPVAGLVQIPCIERNAIASVKAVNAARLAMRTDGTHKVTLDQAIRTMRETGKDMKSKYKETSRGGLAVNVVEC